MDEFARAAVDARFTDYGFSPHSPVPLDSPCNMSLESVPEYMAEVDRIRDAYPSTRFYRSMEVDYLGSDWGPANQYFQDLGLDYIIGSVHFIPSQDGQIIDIDGSFERFNRNMAQYFRDDIRYVVEKFYAQSIDMVRAGGFDIIGHFDKIGQNAAYYQEGVEDTAWYQDCVQALIDSIIDARLVVEINTKAYANHHRFFPSPRYLDRLRRADITLVVNSDAHYPALINASRDIALSLINA